MALNPQQRAAVRHLGTPLLVLAGAGSGKTRVIIEKMAFLIEQGHYPAERIAAITFTNKAAREMRSRISKRLKSKDSQALTLSTFHSLGWQMIKAHREAIGRRAGLTILDQHSAWDLVRELHPPGTKDEQVWAVVNWISRFKDHGETQPSGDPEHPIQAFAASLYPLYQQRLQDLNAVDFDDLIALPVRLLSDPSVAAQWQQRWPYVLVDEVQDTSTSQYRLLQKLVGRTGGLTAVGDDDQSIYAWRGARPENLDLMSRDYPNLEVIKLEQNYRSSGNILTASNALIAINPHTHSKRLWSEHGPGEAIQINAYADDQDEAEATAQAIFAAHHASRARWRDCAVLYRSNAQSRPLEMALRTLDIPYRISGGPSWFDAREVRDALAYLRLLINPDDNPAVLRVANTPRRGLGSVAMATWGRHAQHRQCSLFEAATDQALQDQLPAAAGRGLRAFSTGLIEFSSRLEQAGIEQIGGVLTEWLDHIEYPAWLAANTDDPIKLKRRQRSLSELADWVSRLAAQVSSGDELLARLALASGPDDDRHEGEDSVRLMTLHAAKGLEFPRVWLAGCEEGLLPHERSVEEGQIEEERRLMYVGLTRAERHLALSYCLARKRRDGARQCQPSRFLDELPEAVIAWPARHGSEQAEPDAARANIAALRALLDN